MKTSDVKCNTSYLCDNEEVVVLERIKGDITKKPCMQSGIMNVGNHRKQKRFLLSNGKIVKAEKLNKL